MNSHFAGLESLLVVSLDKPIEALIDRVDQSLVSLSVPRQAMRFCLVCEREEIFVAGWQCERGLVGCCMGCGDERVIPFTRTNSEVA